MRNAFSSMKFFDRKTFVSQREINENENPPEKKAQGLVYTTPSSVRSINWTSVNQESTF